MSRLSAYLTNGSDEPCRIKLAGELDLSSRPLADEVLESASHAPKLVLDLSELEFIDSMGIQFVVTAHARAARDGRDFTIVRGGPRVTRVFSLVGLDDVLPFADAV